MMTIPVTCKPRWMAGSGGQKSVMLSREPYYISSAVADISVPVFQGLGKRRHGGWADPPEYISSQPS